MPADRPTAAEIARHIADALEPAETTSGLRALDSIEADVDAGS